MSGDLTITFADDMPIASVEVVAPDMQVVSRMMLGAGRSKTVTVPSEMSFLRVHLPTGQVATLTDPGNLARTISLESILGKPHRILVAEARHENDSDIYGFNPMGRTISVPDVMSGTVSIPDEMKGAELTSQYAVQRYFRRAPLRNNIMIDHHDTLSLSDHARASIVTYRGDTVPGHAIGMAQEACWKLERSDHHHAASTLRLEQSNSAVLDVRLPANLREVRARVDDLKEEGVLLYSIRLTSREPAADAVLNYLQKGDLYSAESMTEWIDEAEGMLFHKVDDPYTAAIASYLLLRLGRYDRMHDWPRNLADWFDFLPDGCVIWARQLMHRVPDKQNEIRDYLFKAVERGLPVYTEGLRILMDGLRLLGPKGQGTLQTVQKQAGDVLWQSPVTATLHRPHRDSAGVDLRAVLYDIEFAAGG